jgi:pimeloyl-ACP methyl ester carboxylesterase/DNA-binding CsgD family transcriptional regulator
MDAPQIQYLRTDDGYDIAYAVTGIGHPLVFLPQPHNDLHGDWQPEARKYGWLAGLSQRFRLVQYDMRGQGMSTRNLKAGLTLDRLVADLEALRETVGIESFLLMGASNYGVHLAVRYAASYPLHVDGLVLATCSIDNRSWPLGLLDNVAAQNWDLALTSLVRLGSPNVEPEPIVARFKRNVTQGDWLRRAEAFADSNVASVLPGIKVPVLIMHSMGFALLDREESIKLAARIPNSRVTLVDGRAALPDPAPGLAAIDEWLAEMLPDFVRTHQVPTVSVDFGLLSERQREVLHLIATGKTTREIADELFLSVRTIERHIASLYARLRLRNRAEATAFVLGRRGPD